MREEEKLPWGTIDTIGKLHDRIYTLENELTRTHTALEGLREDTTRVIDYLERDLSLDFVADTLRAALSRAKRAEKGEK